MADLRDRVQAALGTAYRIERELGGGGMSRVFLAEEIGLARQVVVKVLPPELAVGINAERFHREIQLAASLQHPHIVPLLAAGGVGDVFYYTMPFVEGESLRTRLAREKKLPVRDAVRALREVAGALAYAHARGVVHRDIKPDNVLLSDHHALVTDFGVAKALSRSGGDAALTSLGVVLGTPAYMAPEQAAGDPNVDARADIYALGATGYEMLAGRPPFVDLAPHRMLAAHVVDPVTPVAEYRPDAPPQLADLVMRCLDKNPARRPQTAGEVRDALQTADGTHATSVARRPARGPVFAALGLGVAAGAAWLALQSRPTIALDPDRIAVAPFDVLDSRLALWHEGLVDVLSRSLDGAGPLRTVSPTVVVRRWSGRADAVSARELGRETGARTVVFGGLVGAGADSVRLSATVLDVATGTTLGEIELRDQSARMDRVADSLAVRVLREIGRSRPIGLVRGTPLGSASLPAVKAFLQGEQFLRRSQWDSAIVYDQHAIALDSGFALAWSHAGLAIGWAHSASDSLSVRYKLRAGSLNQGLAPRESLIVQAESLGAAVWGGADQLGGRTLSYARRMLATLSDAVRRYPTDPELWYMLGDAAYHAGSSVGYERQRSLDAFDRSIALDSAFTPSYVHAIQLALELRGPTAARRYASGYLRAGAMGDYATSTELILRLLDPRTAQSDATVRLIDTMPMHGQHLAFFAIAGWPDSAETTLWFARRHGERMLREATTAGDSGFATTGIVVALAFRGHLHEAYESGGRGDPMMFAQTALLGGVPPDTAAAVFRSWIGWKHDAKTRWWWALPWWAERRDTSAIASIERRAVSGLRRPPVSPIAIDLLNYVALSARAYLALARGDSVAALRLFDVLPDSACFGMCDLDGLVRIKLLAAQGRYPEAAQRLAATPKREWRAAMSPTRVLWELERGRVHERLGNRDSARAGYAFVTAAWARADSALQPYVTQARAGLSRLSAEPKP
jgi:eukaryotic-like serine/threonine-protein kinase